MSEEHELTYFDRLLGMTKEDYKEHSVYSIKFAKMQKQLDLYKSVLDEIREYINNTVVMGDGTKMKDTMDGERILQILDKVKQ